MFHDESEPLVDLRMVDEVGVVQHQKQLPRQGGDLVEQGGQQRGRQWRLWRGQSPCRLCSQRRTFGAACGSLQGGNEVAPEAHRLVIFGGKRKPAKPYLPLCLQGVEGSQRRRRLAEAGRRADQCQGYVARLLQFRVQPRAGDQLGAQWRNDQLRLQQWFRHEHGLYHTGFSTEEPYLRRLGPAILSRPKLDSFLTEINQNQTNFQIGLDKYTKTVYYIDRLNTNVTRASKLFFVKRRSPTYKEIFPMKKFVTVMLFVLVFAFAIALAPAAEAAPPGPTIVDTAIAVNSSGSFAGSFDTLIAAVLAADPAVVNTLSGNGQYTVFAPTDDAFAALGLTPANVGSLPQDALTEILLYHVAPGRRDASDVLSSDRIRTLSKDFLMQDSGVLTDNLGREANIIVTDVEAANGIIHAIDAVVLPFAP